MHAARNVALCTKDCLCLFVCPSGATDTENGQIDFAKCLDGCRLCVDACPSHAIYLVFDRYPEKPAKHDRVVSVLDATTESKVEQERICRTLAEQGGLEAKLAKALALSNRILAEDCTRESGFMLPQAPRVKTMLESLQNREGDAVPRETVDSLLNS